MQYAAQNKNKSVSFRTTKEVNEQIEELAARIKANKWEFNWQHPMRKADSKSGLIHQVLAGHLTLKEIRENLNKVEGDNNETN